MNIISQLRRKLSAVWWHRPIITTPARIARLTEDEFNTGFRACEKRHGAPTGGGQS